MTSILATLVLTLGSCDGTGILAGDVPGEDAGEPGPGPGEEQAPDSLGATAVNECDFPRAGWIFCDDFERDRLDRYYAHDRADGGYVRAEEVGIAGSSGMRVRWSPGQVTVGTLQVMIGRNPVTNRVAGDPGRDYRELYWRMYLKHQPGFVGGGADKLSRATVLAGSDWRQAMIAHVWSGQGSRVNQLVIDPASGTDAAGNLRTTRYNDFDNLRWMGISAGSRQIFHPEAVGRWYCVEAHVRLNDPGASNGVFTLWIDDEVEVSRTSLNWLGRYSAYGLNAVFFENYWNAGSPVAQERYFDNVVISTERIGCAEGEGG